MTNNLLFHPEYVKNCHWENAEQTLFSCIVKYEEFPEEMPAGITLADPYEHIKLIWSNAMAGMYGPIKAWEPPVPPPPPEPVPPTAEENKQKAITRLQDTDWTAAEDVGNPQVANPYLVNQAEFLSYRSAVRAIAVDPVAGFIQWPVKPTEQWSS